MESYINIEKALLEPDGSANDITFTPVILSKVERFLAEVSAEFRVDNAFNGDNGVDVTDLLAARRFGEVLGGDSGTFYSYWSSSSHVISSLQVFVSWPENEKDAFIELTFFPQDLVSGRFELTKFAAIVEQWCQVLDASDFFVRCENASWPQFDASSPDVFFSRRNRPRIGVA